MKRIHILSATFLLAAAVLTSCSVAASSDEAQASSGVNLIESTAYAGIWQKHVEVELTDDDGNTINAIRPTNLFKIILPDGNYFLFRAMPNGEPKSVDSRIEVYGTYQNEGDTLVVEHLLTNCAKPELSNIKSDLHFNMPDKDHMNVYYNLRNADGTAGSSEFVPELWVRVPTH